MIDLQEDKYPTTILQLCCHIFLGFEKAFDRVWHEALWPSMRKQNINANSIRVIENRYDLAQGVFRSMQHRTTISHTAMSTHQLLKHIPKQVYARLGGRNHPWF